MTTLHKSTMSSPEQLIQRQLDAYNAKDVGAWLQTYHPQAEQFQLHGGRLACGHDELRSRIVVRFQEPDLHARLLGRSVMGNVVVDHERITRNFPEGLGYVEMLCIYEVSDHYIVKATFASSPPVMAMAC